MIVKRLKTLKYSIFSKVAKFGKKTVNDKKSGFSAFLKVLYSRRKKLKLKMALKKIDQVVKKFFMLERKKTIYSIKSKPLSLCSDVIILEIRKKKSFWKAVVSDNVKCKVKGKLGK